jgi:cyanophycin synthetase
VVQRIARDLDFRTTLRAAGLGPRSVPPRGVAITVKGVANQGSETESESVTGQIGEPLRSEGSCAARALGVRLAGVDVITTDPSRSLKEAAGVVNEVNTTPGLHLHYQVRNTEAMVPVAVPILRRLLGLDGDPAPAAAGGATDA